MLDLLLEAASSLAVARLVSAPRSLDTWPTRAACITLLGHGGWLLSQNFETPLRSASVSVRLGLLLCGHFGALLLDAWYRLGDAFYWRQFLITLGRSALYVAPVAPLLIVGGSTLLMVGTSTLKLFGAEPSNLRWLVNLGALHCPFWFIHIHARRSLGINGKAGGGSAPSLLPVTTPPPHERRTRSRLLGLGT